jgi:uncharacterized membrane protein YccC
VGKQSKTIIVKVPENQIKNRIRFLKILIIVVLLFFTLDLYLSVEGIALIDLRYFVGALVVCGIYLFYIKQLKLLLKEKQGKKVKRKNRFYLGKIRRESKSAPQ